MSECKPASMPGHFLVYFLAVFAALLASVPAPAQERKLTPGSAVVTSFSGLIADIYSRREVIDLGGKVLRVIDLSADGQPDELFAIEARELGQVQGLAVDAGETPRIFVAASSAYGLRRTGNNGTWMQGQWGPSGGPGSIYVLSAADGFRPKLLLDARTGQRGNSGAGMGALAYDAKNDLLYASDLETGLVLRINATSGEVLGTFDHGVDARAYFIDTETGKKVVRDIVSFDPKSKPRISDCGTGDTDEAATRYSSDPSCWNMADFRRRVWALTLGGDPQQAGARRLYYSVWGAAALGSKDWKAGEDDSSNTIWSLALDDKGGFDLTSVRREAVLPRTPGSSNPVAALAVLDAGALLAAERIWPMPQTGADSVEPRSFLLQPKEGGGFKPEDGPGQIAVAMDPGETAVWGIAALDCSGAACTPAAAPQVGARAGLIGLGGGDFKQRLAIVAPLGKERAPVKVEQIGSVALYRGEAVSASPAAVQEEPSAETPVAEAPASDTPPVTEPDQPATEEPAAAPQQEPSEPALTVGPPSAIDLALEVTAPDSCKTDIACTLDLSLRNESASELDGPVTLMVDIGGRLALSRAEPSAWTCGQRGERVSCLIPRLNLVPQATSALQIQFSVPGSIFAESVRACATLSWLAAEGPEQVRAVQAELARRGFDPGPADGVMGQRTHAAIVAVRADMKLPESGAIDEDLLGALFGSEGLRGEDNNSDNDKSCTQIAIDLPERSNEPVVITRPGHHSSLSAFHATAPSVAHDPRTTRAQQRIHDEIMSRFHARYSSSMHDGRTTRPIDRHNVELSRFHRTSASSLHDGRFTDASQRHNRAVSSFHNRAPSAVHDSNTTRARLLHNNALSAFHQRYRSAMHDGRNTSAGPVHSPSVSAFHGRWNSSVHHTASSRHATGQSAFHNQYESRFHDQFSSGVVPFYRERHNSLTSQFR